MEESNRMPEKGKEQGSFAAACYEWVEALITALTAVMILFVFLFRVNIGVIGDSMKPNYQDGYRVFVSCVDHRLSRGDIVVVDSNATKLKERIIKRVIATEGQKVNIDFDTGIVSVDGQELDESAYIKNGITKNQYDLKFPQTVPPGHIFVLGDNRTISNDSRSSDIGMIDCRYVIGKVDFLLKPFRGFTRV